MNIRNNLLIIAGFVAVSATAQNLSTEVVVDRSVLPEERATSRPQSITPVVVIDDATTFELTPSSYTELTDFSGTYTPLAPAEGSFAACRTPYRGYVVGGYFPVADFGISAGYRFIDRKNMVLGARLQFDSERYRPFPEAASGQGTQYFADAVVGVDFAWKPVAGSTLSAYAQYNFLREKSAFWESQNMNAGKFGAKWNSHVGQLGYRAEIDFHVEKESETFTYYDEFPADRLLPGLSQRTTNFGVEAWLPAGAGSSRAGIDVNGSFVNTTGDIIALHTRADVGTIGAVDVTPHYTYSIDRFTARLGVKLDFATGGQRNKLNFMPDVRLAWVPSSAVGVYANFTGGSVLNPFTSLRQTTVYQAFTAPYMRSRIPLKIDAGANFGPFRGFYLGVFGGYAMANDWLMMSDSALEPFEPLDVRGWHAGAKMGAEWKMVKAEVSADFAPSGYKKAWYSRRDRASVVVDANVSVTPVRPLTVTVDYEFRSGRKAYADVSAYPDIDYICFDLGNVSNLSLGAEWRFNDAFAAFLRMENLLCHRYMTVAWQPSRKLHGLVGVSYKF